MMSSVSKVRWAAKVAAAGAIACLAGQTAFGAAVIRDFSMNIGLAVNPDDPEGDLIDPVAGAPVAFVFNENSDDPTWDLESPIGSEPLFVEGRLGLAGDLAVFFDGSRPDPESDPSIDNAPTQLFGRKLCSWCPDSDSREILLAASDGQFSSTFNVGNQAWIKPDIAGLGNTQYVYATGNGNTGGVGITPEGNWAHVWSRNGGIQFTDTGVPVAFGEWTHVGAITTGNLNRLFVNGSAVNQGFGWFGGGGQAAVGVRNESGVGSFIGAVDDLKFMVTSVIVGGFSAQVDLDFFEDVLFSGVTADVNQDGAVDEADYVVWAANVGFNNGVGFGDPSTLLKGDVNGNGVVDFADLTVIKGAAAAAGTPIPEPASLALLAMGGLAMARRRNRVA
jgi:hypothetical protein